jgi:hypothetical protein
MRGILAVHQTIVYQSVSVEARGLKKTGQPPASSSSIKPQTRCVVCMGIMYQITEKKQYLVRAIFPPIAAVSCEVCGPPLCFEG